MAACPQLPISMFATTDVCSDTEDTIAACWSKPATKTGESISYRYLHITRIARKQAIGVVWFCGAIAVLESQVVFVKLPEHISEWPSTMQSMWGSCLPFSGHLNVMQHRQPWPPPPKDDTFLLMITYQLCSSLWQAFSGDLAYLQQSCSLPKYNLFTGIFQLCLRSMQSLSGRQLGVHLLFCSIYGCHMCNFRCKVMLFHTGQHIAHSVLILQGEVSTELESIQHTLLWDRPTALPQTRGTHGAILWPDLRYRSMSANSTADCTFFSTRSLTKGIQRHIQFHAVVVYSHLKVLVIDDGFCKQVFVHLIQCSTEVQWTVVQLTGCPVPKESMTWFVVLIVVLDMHSFSDEGFSLGSKKLTKYQLGTYLNQGNVSTMEAAIYYYKSESTSRSPSTVVFKLHFYNLMTEDP